MKNNDVINRICANAIINHALLNNDEKLIWWLIGNRDNYNLSDYNETVKLISDNLKITYTRNIPVYISEIPPLFISAYEHCILKTDLYRFYSMTDTDKYFNYLRKIRHPRHKKLPLNKFESLNLEPFVRNFNGTLDELVNYAELHRCSLRMLCEWIYYGK